MYVDRLFLVSSFSVPTGSEDDVSASGRGMLWRRWCQSSSSDCSGAGEGVGRGGKEGGGGRMVGVMG